MKIYCCGCEEHVTPRQTIGSEIYPHWEAGSSIPFFKCDECGNYVGCHKGSKPLRPLGCIPTVELRGARAAIHAVIDPIWKVHGVNRKQVYADLAKLTGRKKYHTANIRTVDEAREVYDYASSLYEKYRITKNDVRVTEND